MHIFVSIGKVGASPQIGEILPPFSHLLTVLSCPVLFFHFFSRSYAQVEPLDRFYRSNDILKLCTRDDVGEVTRHANFGFNRCMLNFDEISQSTAEIKVLPVSENWQPPYWHSISGFNFDVCIVIDMSFCIWLPNFVVIRRLSALYLFFQDGRRQPYWIWSG